MSEKPEWFKITEGDQASTQNEFPKVAKPRNGRFKVAVLAVPLLAVGAFAVAAHGGEDDAPALPKLSAISNSTSVATTTPAVTHTANFSSTKKVTRVSSSLTKSPAKPGIGIQPPKGGGDDGHEGFEGEDD